MQDARFQNCRAPLEEGGRGCAASCRHRHAESPFGSPAGTGRRTAHSTGERDPCRNASGRLGEALPHRLSRGCGGVPEDPLTGAGVVPGGCGGLATADRCPRPSARGSKRGGCEGLRSRR